MSGGHADKEKEGGGRKRPAEEDRRDGCGHSKRSRGPDSRRANLVARLGRDLRTVFFAQIVSSAREGDLRELLEDASIRVRSVRVVRDPRTGRSKGMAYAELNDIEDVPRAVTLTGENVRGFPVVIQASGAEKNVDEATLEDIAKEVPELAVVMGLSSRGKESSGGDPFGRATAGFGGDAIEDRIAGKTEAPARVVEYGADGRELIVPASEGRRVRVVGLQDTARQEDVERFFSRHGFPPTRVDIDDAAEATDSEGEGARASEEGGAAAGPRKIGYVQLADEDTAVESIRATDGATFQGGKIAVAVTTDARNGEHLGECATRSAAESDPSALPPIDPRTVFHDASHCVRVFNVPPSEAVRDTIAAECARLAVAAGGVLMGSSFGRDGEGKPEVLLRFSSPLIAAAARLRLHRKWLSKKLLIAHPIRDDAGPATA